MLGFLQQLFVLFHFALAVKKEINQIDEKEELVLYTFSYARYLMQFNTIRPKQC